MEHSGNATLPSIRIGAKLHISSKMVTFENLFVHAFVARIVSAFAAGGIDDYFSGRLAGVMCTEREVYYAA